MNFKSEIEYNRLIKSLEASFDELHCMISCLQNEVSGSTSDESLSNFIEPFASSAEQIGQTIAKLQEARFEGVILRGVKTLGSPRK